MQQIVNGPWPKGINSLLDPAFIGDDQVQWSVNTVNRGGNYQTRPGYSIIKNTAAQLLFPRGLTLFTPKDQEPCLVSACGTLIYVSRYPFTLWYSLSGITLDESDSQVIFEPAIKGTVTHDDGTLEILENPYPVLMIQTGNNRAAYWDGTVARHLDPTRTAELSETPVGTWMKWSGSRLWVANGSKLLVSNVLDPLKFTESDITASGGAYFLPSACTGFAETADQQSLLAFTENSTTSFQSSIEDRSQWGATAGFQRIILPEIGCIAGRTIVNKYGLIWWMSQGGFIGLDGALQTYRSSKITYKDDEMSRGKSNLSKDVSRSCVGAFGNFLTLSVPSGDTYNAQTWVMDEGILDELNASAAPAWSSCWMGTRPVQWVSGMVHGHNRCFFQSMDYPASADASDEWIAGVWEAFCGDKVDVGLNSSNALTAKPIQCALETKFISPDDSAKTFDHFKIRLQELSRSSHIDGFYASSKAGYKQVLDKDIVATTDSLNMHLIAEDISTTVPSYLKQSRTLMSDRDVAQDSDLDEGAESIYTRNKDRGFSILLKWYGQMMVPWIILAYNPKGEQSFGRVEDDELKIRTVLPTGENTIGTLSPLTPTYLKGKSTTISNITPKWSEISYSSNS